MPKEYLDILKQREVEKGYEPKEGAVAKIVSKPPLLTFVESELSFMSQREIERILATSHQMDRPFSAWETVRKGAVPVVGAHQTGFEGYLIGRVNSEDEAQELLKAFGLNIWADLFSRYKHSYRHRSILEKVILGDSINPEGIKEWSIILGATLARRRAEILTIKPAQEFREETKKKTQALPQVRYVVGPDGLIEQEYFIAGQKANPSKPGDNFRNDEERLALSTIRNIGRFGHPLVRAVIQSK